MILLLAAPVGAASPLSASPRSAPGAPVKGAPWRDAVIGSPSPAAARISADAWENRYAINDGSEATIAISVTSNCAESCTDAAPQQIADFIGTLAHSYEVELLRIQLDAPFQIEFDCGYGAQACYYPGENKIVLSGDDTTTSDGASREFVLAHEYGHHIAQHRESPAPFPAAIDWGTARWSSFEHVCQGRREGSIFPGDEGTHYYEDPGEAFAEAYAHLRFPQTKAQWKYIPSLRPSPQALREIREDVLHPWLGRTSFSLSGRLPPRRRGGVVKSFRTPLDGTVSLRPRGSFHRRFRLSLMNPAGRLLRTSQHGLSPHRQLNFTVCGQAHLRAQVKSARSSSSPYRLQIQRP
jgi:hypothetical protein